MTPAALPAAAGEKPQASRPELPAAIEYNILLAERFTARSSVRFAPPPRLMLAIAGRTAFFVTQSTPLITSEVDPLPEQVRTFTPLSGAPGATPTTSLLLSLAATVPAT